jgi:hypothetical protein
MAGAGAFISEVSRGGVNGALIYACHRWFSKPGRSFISTEVCPKSPRKDLGRARRPGYCAKAVPETTALAMAFSQRGP